MNHFRLARFFLVTVVFFFATTSVRGADLPPQKMICQATRWPFAPLPKQASERIRILENMNRADLHQYLLNEVTAEKPSQTGMAFHLSHYLRNTTTQYSYRVFYSAVQVAAELESPSHPIKRVELKELCKVHPHD